MNLRPLHHAVFVALLAVVPLAAAQAAGTQGGGNDAATSSTANDGSHDATSAHGAMHRSRNATHARTRSTTAAHTGGNPEYEAALRRCVQMNGDGRERCLDEAIARYGS